MKILILFLISSFVFAFKLNLTLDEKLYAAINYGNLIAVQKYLSQGANPNSYNANDQKPHTTMLIRAVRKGYCDIARALLQAGADPDLRKPTSIAKRAIHVAVKYERLDCMDALFENNVEVNFQQNFSKNTLLHWTVLRKRGEVLGKVVNYSGMDLNLRNVTGLCALEVSARNDQVENVRTLLSHSIEKIPFDQDCVAGAMALTESSEITSLLRNYRDSVASKP